MVTPHVGVWIETSTVLIVFAHTEVTPHVGVWIETLQTHKKASFTWSHLM